MTTPQQIYDAIQTIHDQKSFVHTLLTSTLGWPIPDGIDDIGDITFEWSSDELQADGLNRHLADGRVFQIRKLEADQPWGIFLLEFKNEDVFLKNRGLTGPLRKVLRGLVHSRRKSSDLPSWGRDNLLFICTDCRYKHFRFAYFKTPRRAGLTEPLITFGWGPDIPCRTACEFNLPALFWPEDPSDSVGWLKKWSAAFDKEPLTREFFKRFDKSLEAIKADLEQLQKLSSAEAYSHAQLLLERLLFLYFLQNRGWLNRERHFRSEERRVGKDCR